MGRSVRGRTLFLAIAVAGCASMTSTVTVDLGVDVPSSDVAGRAMSRSSRRALAEESAVSIVVHRVCGTDRSRSSRACRRDPPRVSSIARVLGSPPDPAEVVARVGSAHLGDPARREAARRTYFDMVRTRYRLWAEHVGSALDGAAWVEVRDGSGRTIRRCLGVGLAGCLASAFAGPADHYAALEWRHYWTSRHGRGRPEVAPGAPGAPNSAGADVPDGAGGAQSGDMAGSLGRLCPQTCDLRRRACDAGCDAGAPETAAGCAGACAAEAEGCRERCEAPAP